MQGHNALVLFSGDSFNPSMMSTITAGAQMPPGLNQAQEAALYVGNHDLDFGLDRLVELAKACHFPGSWPTCSSAKLKICSRNAKGNILRLLVRC
jgi:2',3'-cyclic-nucleotide 2'-phosphodiesterase (5'-nucleotidase family)